MYRDGDELVGSTEIALMDRAWSPSWQRDHRKRPPLERRSLRSRHSNHPQGYLEMWVDILTTDQAAKSPPIEIAPAPPIECELRVIVWEALCCARQSRSHEPSACAGRISPFCC